MKRTYIETCFYNSKIIGSVEELTEVLLEPRCQPSNDKNGVNFEWDYKAKDGGVFTIYGWKEYRSQDERIERIGWNIRGNNGFDTSTAEKEVILLLTDAFFDSF